MVGKKSSKQGIGTGVRMKSRFMRFSEMFDFREKPLTSPLFKHVTNFESAKLGRFGTTFYDRT